MAFIGLLLCLALVSLWASYLNTPSVKGAHGERRVHAALCRNLTDDYHVFADLTLPSQQGTTQIDHVVVSRFGIFVIETKNMQGWIFGSADQGRWTQTIFGHKARFQNPLRQNFKHVKAVEAAVGADLRHIHSLVVFVGSAVPRTEMPNRVTWSTGELLRSILSERQVLMKEEQVAAIVAILSSQDFRTDRNVRRAHVLQTKEAMGNCPKCGSKLVLRTNPKTNSQFFRCSRYPTCRGTRPFE